MPMIELAKIQLDRDKLYQSQQKEAIRRYKERATTRGNIVKALAVKNPLEVDMPERVAVRMAIINPRDGLALERIMGESDLFPISYLEAGLIAAKPVCRIEVHDTIGRVLGFGTGFLVSPSLIITNNHVLDTEEVARFSLAQFNYEVDLQHMPRATINFRLDPSRFFITSRDLDFTIVAVEPTSPDGTKLSDYGSLQFREESGKALLGEYVSIIQHPSGGPKAVAIRENEVVDCFDCFLHYATDTESGSSGSPVFGDDWRVVALHHMSVPSPDDPSKYVANEGIRISSIMNDLLSRLNDLSSDRKCVLNEILSQCAPVTVGGAVPEHMLIGNIDKELYDDMIGYDEAFLGPDCKIPLPTLSSDLKQDIVSLKSGGSILNYTHFSIAMSKSRRLAIYTAVNIDGSQKKNIERVADKWYFDPRLENEYQSGPELYENNELDHGHLVRRLDPVWGEDAAEANEDTFHFTNCSPQHKSLNQHTWQNLENYILANASKYSLKVTVFTGPVFRQDDVLYRGQYRIPAEYWKVVVMVRDDGAVSATAYLQTQKNLIVDLEFAYGQYRTYQVPIANIEGFTGLSFGDLSKHDPIANIEATMGRVIERPEDIRL
jgi:endonuclease G